MSEHQTRDAIGTGSGEPVDDAVAEAEQLLRMGEPLLAYNAIQPALADAPMNIRLRQLKGLALARSGASLRANEELASLYREGLKDGETLGLLARTHKDLGLAATSPLDRERHFAAAYEFYVTGYRESGRNGRVHEGYYTGINAATLALLRNDTDNARALAAEVEALCRQALQQANGIPEDAYWPQATLAEAALIVGDVEAAKRRYAATAALAGDRFGDLSTTRHQARLILHHLGDTANWLDEVISVPPVLVFTGHMVDAPGRATPRFAPAMEEAVRNEILGRLQQLKPLAAYGSGACGADILCLECVHQLGGELHIILPFPVEQFREESVALRSDGGWAERFERLVECANEVLVTSERPPQDCARAFEYTNLVITGLARLRAQLLDTRLVGLAVWDGTDGGEDGGTASVVSLWESTGLPLELVSIPPADPALAARVESPGSRAAPEPTREKRDGFEYRIKAMLFADAVGYSKLSEDQIPLFLDRYIGSIAAFNQATDYKAIHIETAGDGMYMVFDDPFTAGHYALDLMDLINRTDWASQGLPRDLSVRIGLHCGPVFVGADPITHRPLYTGIHTNRTARIEPITPPGQVYASSAFAAVSIAERAKGLRFSYVGRTRLAKDYGVFPLYHVKRQDETSVLTLSSGG